MVWSQAIEDKVGEVFKAMDKDGSGAVSVEEYKKFRRAMSMDEANAAHYMARADKYGVIVLF